MTPHQFNTEYLQEQYELLRSEALATCPHMRKGRGLSLFLTRGMKAWMEAVSCLAGPRPAAKEPGASRLPISLPPEIPTVLANMVLGCMQETHP